MNQEMGEEFPEGIDPTHTNNPLLLGIQNLLHPEFNASSGNSDHPNQHMSLQSRENTNHRT